MRNRNAGLSFIFITLLIDVIGFGLVIPVLPKLVKEMAGGETAGVHIFGLLQATYGLMQFVFAPVLGNLSDRFGRRPVILLSLLFTGLDYILLALAPNLGWFFVGRVLAGIFGASFTAATAYIADVSPPDKRAQSFGLLGAAFGLGFIIGPALGGLVGGFGPRIPFWVAAACSLINVLYGAFVLPESLDKDNRRPFSIASINPLSAFAILARHRWVLGLAFAALALWIAQQVPPSTWVFYTEHRFGWKERDNGLSLALVGVCSMFIQLVVIRQLSKRMSDLRMLAVSMVINFLGFILLGLSTTGTLMMLAMVFWSFSFIGGPALQSMVSKQFDSNEQGAIQGALTSLQSLSSVFGPPLLTFVFGYFTAPGHPYIPGSAFFTGSALTVVAAALVAVGLKIHPPQTTEREAV